MRAISSLSIQTRIILLVGMIATAMLAGALGTQILARHQSESLAAGIQRDRASFYSHLLDLRSARMKAVVLDYASRDDMEHFVQNPSSKWGSQNLDTALSTYDLDCAWLYNSSMQCVYGVASGNTHSLETSPLSASTLQYLRVNGPYHHFFLETCDGLLEVRGSSIWPSRDILHTGPPVGYFYVGRIWDPEYQAELAGITGSRISIVPFDEFDTKLDRNRMEYDQTLDDWYGQRVATLKLIGDDSLTPLIERSSANFMIVTDIFAILFIAVITLCLYMWVSRPIGQLSSAIAKESLDEIGDIANDRAEMGRLAKLISEFFEQKIELKAANELLEIRVAERTDELAESNRKLRAAYAATIEGWSRALDLRDHETEGHSLRVTEMTLLLARSFAFSEDELLDIERGALLHDIGKMGIPDDILRKPGSLTDKEWEVMRKHPEFAKQMLQPITFLRPALDIPYCHHEKWDGTGYPRGLAGEEIPLAARIFAVADVWDALSSNRPYRRAWPLPKVRQHIASLSGIHFDPAVVEKLLQQTTFVEEETQLLKAA